MAAQLFNAPGRGIRVFVAGNVFLTSYRKRRQLSCSPKVYIWRHKVALTNLTCCPADDLNR
jgi:hypothetical protein